MATMTVNLSDAAWNLAAEAADGRVKLTIQSSEQPLQVLQDHGAAHQSSCEYDTIDFKYDSWLQKLDDERRDTEAVLRASRHCRTSRQAQKNPHNGPITRKRMWLPAQGQAHAFAKTPACLCDFTHRKLDRAERWVAATHEQEVGNLHRALADVLSINHELQEEAEAARVTANLTRAKLPLPRLHLLQVQGAHANPRANNVEAGLEEGSDRPTSWRLPTSVARTTDGERELRGSSTTSSTAEDSSRNSSSTKEECSSRSEVSRTKSSVRSPRAPTKKMGKAADAVTRRSRSNRSGSSARSVASHKSSGRSKQKQRGSAEKLPSPLKGSNSTLSISSHKPKSRDQGKGGTKGKAGTRARNTKTRSR